LANLLDRPEVVSWISKVTPKDLALIKDLPEEQKEVFTQNLGELVKDAQKRKLPVSRALTALVVGGGAAATTPKTLQQLRKEALQLQQQQAASAPDVTQPAVEEPTQTQPEQAEPVMNEPVEEEEPEQ
jgi:predicted XRE-type DNA-binding protein